MKDSQIGLFYCGTHAWEGTRQYEHLVKKAAREARDKYSTLLVKEKNPLKRLVITLKREIALERRIRELSSPRNLHARSRGAFY